MGDQTGQRAEGQARPLETVAFSFEATAEDFRALWREKRWGRIRRRGWIVPAYVLFLVWISGGLGAPDPRLWTMPRPTSLSEAVRELAYAGMATESWWIPLLAVASMWWFISRRSRRMREQGLVAWTSRGEVVVEASAGGLSVRDELSTSRYLWSAFLRCEETTAGTLLWFSALRSLDLPRSDRNAGALAAVVRLWRERESHASQPFVVAPGTEGWVISTRMRGRDYAMATRLHPSVQSTRRWIWAAAACTSGYLLIRFCLAVLSAMAHHEPLPAFLSAEGITLYGTLLFSVLMWGLPWGAFKLGAWWGWRLQRRMLGVPRTWIISERGVANVIHNIWADFRWQAFHQAVWGKEVLVLVMMDRMMFLLPTREIPQEQRGAIEGMIRSHVGTGAGAFPMER
jgi:hypothetical protein